MISSTLAKTGKTNAGASGLTMPSPVRGAGIPHPAPRPNIPPLWTSTSRDSINDPGAWESRRNELIALFEDHVYGRNPRHLPETAVFSSIEPDREAFGGLAIRRLVRGTFSEAPPSLSFSLPLYLPASQSARGCLLLINHREPCLVHDAESSENEFWPVRELILAGFASAAIQVDDFVPDDASKARLEGWLARDRCPSGFEAENFWGAIAAWSWGASRALDYLASTPLLQGIPHGVVGHSRGGKAALWCGALDQRVALTISNQSGRNGAALGRVSQGESIAEINRDFPHWFCERHKCYSLVPDSLPIDQHHLLALIAPRLVYVSSAIDDSHADPRAEFASALAASPAFHLLGAPGLAPQTFPAEGGVCHEGGIGYHLRLGGHDLRLEDWRHFMAFAGQHWAARD